VLFAAFAETKSDLYEAPLEKHLQRHQRQAVIFSGFCKLADLSAVQQQLAFALAGMIVDTGLCVLGNVTVTQPDFFVVDSRVAFVQSDFVVANAFDFAAGQNDAAVQFIQNVKFMPRTAITADDLAIC